MQLLVVLLVCTLTPITHAQYWTVTGNLTFARAVHTATLLANGNVLVAGGNGNGSVDPLNSAELYDATGLWTLTGFLSYARTVHTATLLPNGNVLVAGGTENSFNALNSAELYNATTGVWTVTGNLTYARFSHTATLLTNGNVLVAAGIGTGDVTLNSAEVYSATTGVWTVTGNLVFGRFSYTATLLTNGNVLVAAGLGSNENSAELYNPTTGVWTVTGNLTYARFYHTATLLPNGNVLVASGYNGSAYLNSAELYNSTTCVWTVTGSLTYARQAHTATLLPHGNILVAGGEGGTSPYYLNSAEVYNAATGVWTVTGNLTYARDEHTATLLPNGNVLVAAGYGRGSIAELYNATATTTTTLTSPPTTPAQTSGSTAPTNTPTMPTPTSPSTSSTDATPTPTPFGSVISASSPNAGAIAGGIVGGLAGVIILLLLLLWFLRSRYWNKKEVNSSDYTKPMIPMARPKSERSVSQVSDARQSDDIYISFNSLKLGAVLGQGHFGQVYQADYTGAQVAVKKSKGIDEKLILEEATMMKNLPPHPNVLQYFGVSKENGEFMMVTELCDKGNLAQYLRNPKNNLTAQQCRQFCRQIASGMWHISKYGIIHRDLRAENILLSGDNKLVVKVADFGLARSLNSNDLNDSGYYRMTELKEIPVSWTPPEVLNQSDQLKYVAASDVWSFGVVIWEIYSKGAKPFQATPVHAVIAMIRDPIRNVSLLPRPNNCPDDIFAIMNSCWAFNPQDRPTFEQLYNQLS